jgi:hypothetical protein
MSTRSHAARSLATCRKAGVCAALALFCSLVFAHSASGAGGSYRIDGGTSSERAQVHAALNASAFDWSLVPATIQIHIGAFTRGAGAGEGEIWLDPSLLDAGRFSWALVQHEYAHQVDFYLLDPPKRALLRRLLGGKDWCYDRPGLRHDDHACERFASTLAWSYWPSSANCLRPGSRKAEAGAMTPGRFRAVLTRLLGPVDGRRLRTPARAP